MSGPRPRWQQSRSHTPLPLVAIAVPRHPAGSYSPPAIAVHPRLDPAGAAAVTATASTIRALDREPRSVRTAAHNFYSRDWGDLRNGAIR
jgi:hypothetical protein